jgi:hypothetical protein
VEKFTSTSLPYIQGVNLVQVDAKLMGGKNVPVQYKKADRVFGQ